MSDLAPFTGRFRVEKSGLQKQASKRTREVLACSRCRVSKLKCDRLQPCTNCQRKGEQDRCSYSGPGPVLVEDRLGRLESLVKNLMNQNLSLYSTGESGRLEDTRLEYGKTSMDSSEGNQVNGKMKQGEDITYHGSTHWSAMLEDIQGLKFLLAESHESRDHTGALSTSDGFKLGDGEVIYGYSESFSLQQIIKTTLPTKLELDGLIATYIQKLAFMMPFMHTNHLYRQYQHFITHQRQADPLWVSILFSICYLISAMRESTNRNNNSATTPEYNRYHVAAGQCLVIGQYHRPRRHALEALLLYAHSKIIGNPDASRQAGAILAIVVRMAYEMGYHRDPDSLQSLTVFEGEMRRRVWATCKQMDLMLSFQVGLPSNIRYENTDTKSPRNLLDADFDIDAECLPPEKPGSESTPVLWFIVKDKMMPEFSKICQIALSFQDQTEQEIFSLDADIRSTYESVPDVLKMQSIPGMMMSTPVDIMARLYIYLIYQKSLCVLHRRYMARGSKTSTRLCIDVGTNIVSRFIEIHQQLSPGGLLEGHDWMFTSFTFNDFFLGVTVLCLGLHTLLQAFKEDVSEDVTTLQNMVNLLQQSYPICTQKSVRSTDAKRVSRAIQKTLALHERTLSQRLAVQSQSQPTLSNGGTSFSGDEALREHGMVGAEDYMASNEVYLGPSGPLIFMGLDWDSYAFTGLEEPLDLSFTDEFLFPDDTTT